MRIQIRSIVKLKTTSKNRKFPLSKTKLLKDQFSSRI